MPIVILIIFGLLAAPLHAETAPLPASAQATLDQLDQDISSAQTKALKDLNRQAMDLGKQGKLDDALAVKQEADRLELVISKKPVKKAGSSLQSAFNGTWLPKRQEDHAYTWKDGIHTGTFPYQISQGSDVGTYVVEPDGKAITLTFRNGKVQRFTVTSPVEIIDVTSPGTVIWYKKEAP